MKTTVVNCVRCRETHRDLVFHKLDQPVLVNGTYFYYETLCPIANMQILMREVKD